MTSTVLLPVPPSGSPELEARELRGWIGAALSAHSLVVFQLIKQDGDGERVGLGYKWRMITRTEQTESPVFGFAIYQLNKSNLFNS